MQIKLPAGSGRYAPILLYSEGTLDRNSIGKRIRKETLESTGTMPYLAGLILPLINSALRYSDRCAATFERIACSESIDVRFIEYR